MSSKEAGDNTGLCPAQGQKSGLCSWTNARNQFSSLSLDTKAKIYLVQKILQVKQEMKRLRISSQQSDTRTLQNDIRVWMVCVVVT